jgi:hypothetical protein
LNSTAATPAAEYQQGIGALFESRCAACHSEKTKSSGFSVASLESVVAGGSKYGRAIVAGHPEDSSLLRVLSGELGPRMPLGAVLSKPEIERVEQWIRGLTPEDVADVEHSDWRWPFQQPRKHDPPTVSQTSWVRNPIDAFVLNRLETERLAPAPPASKSVLARRVYFDLIGLPPTPAELAAFRDDNSPKAYENLIERLLADPRYGERWGRHWLDLVRYGETSGLEGDGAIGNAWRYRDWVIRAFNSDLPYDEFVGRHKAVLFCSHSVVY